MKLPSIQFYPGDWLRDTISGCSLAAQGLWLRMMILMHDSERYGYLSMNGSPIPPEMIARRCGATPDEYETLLAELDRAAVPSRTSEGIIYSRRMVRDEKKRNLCSEAGKRGGGNPTFKGGAKGAAKGGHKQDPNPSYSSSASASKQIPPRAPQGAPDPEFEKFWDAYPKKRSKGDAEKAWKKINPSTELVGRMLSAIDRAKRSWDWQKDGGQFVPYPATWLNRKGWEDDVKPLQQVGAGPDPDVARRMADKAAEIRAQAERDQERKKAGSTGEIPVRLNVIGGQS